MGLGGSATAAIAHAVHVRCFGSGSCVPAVDVVLRQLCACKLALVLWPAVESLFQALCDASALNPDSDMEEEAGAPLFFDEAEVRGAAICWPEGCSTSLGAGPSGGCVPALLF